MKLNIAEIFYSIQGEGPHLGAPAIFVRFSGCNLRCKWGDVYCDTPYTSWKSEHNFLSQDEVILEINRYRGKTNRIIITGGEPAIQPGLKDLCVALKKENFILDIETNGTAAIPDEIDCIVCSPKMSDSAPVSTKYFEQHEKFRILHPSMHGADSRIYFKFVISEQTNFSEILGLIRAREIPNSRVYFMPLSSTFAELQRNKQFTSNLALQHGFNFSTRLHIELWHGVRGR